MFDVQHPRAMASLCHFVGLDGFYPRRNIIYVYFLYAVAEGPGTISIIFSSGSAPGQLALKPEQKFASNVQKL